MPRSKSSKQWLTEHFQDDFVKRSKAEGYRSRAVYKLMEIQKKDKLIKPGMTVVDLGAAPGGWSQLLAEWVGTKGHVFALDILPIDTLSGVKFILGDFTEQVVLEKLLSAMGDHKADWVLSDMAPNMSGIKMTDQARAMVLAELALDTACQILNLQGGFVTKIFQGADFGDYLKSVRSCFKTVKIRKPEASRARSQEVYLLAQHLK